MASLLLTLWAIGLVFLLFLALDYYINPEPFFKTALTEFEHKIFIGFAISLGLLLFTPIVYLWVRDIYMGEPESYWLLLSILSVGLFVAISGYVVNKKNKT